jgi:hypothetical protein
MLVSKYNIYINVHIYERTNERWFFCTFSVQQQNRAKQNTLIDKKVKVTLIIPFMSEVAVLSKRNKAKYNSCVL